MATPHDILQNLRNRVGTAETGWGVFAEVAIQAYENALGLHKGALSWAKNEVQLQSDQLWKVLNFLLSGIAGPWVPRLLLPIEEVGKAAGTYIAGKLWWVEDLSAAWTSEAMSGLAPKIQSQLKDTALELMQRRGGKTTDPFEPVVESTLIYGSRLKEGIKRRAFLLETAIDQLVESADRWSAQDATLLFNAFVSRCVFITDVPTDTGQKFRDTFQRQAELAMWVAWAIQRDESYWFWTQTKTGVFGHNYKGHEERAAMRSILDRLRLLGVPIDRVSTDEYEYAGGYHNRYLDMLKLIKWAKDAPAPRGWSASPSEQVCQTVNSASLQLRIQANTCSR